MYRQLRVFVFMAVSSTTNKQPKLPKLYIAFTTGHPLLYINRKITQPNCWRCGSTAFPQSFLIFFGNPPIPYSGWFPKLSSFKRTYKGIQEPEIPDRDWLHRGSGYLLAIFYTNCWRTSSSIEPSTEWAMHRPKDSTTKFDGSYASHMAFEAYSISNWRSFN